jgi:serine/threonine protein kinase
VDVWGLAASLYNMLTGHLPRDFPADRDPWLVVLEDDPVPLLRRNASVPRPLAELVDHALREEPDGPFKTAADFRRALNDVA